MQPVGSAFAELEIERCARRQEKQRLEFGGSLRAVGNAFERLADLSGKMGVETVEFFRGHFGLGAKPDRFHRVQSRILDRFLVVFLDRMLHHNGIFDEVGILLDDRGDFPVIEIALCVLFHVHDNRSALRITLCFFDGISLLAVRGPLPRLVRAGFFRDDVHAIRNHERRIEPDAELTDQFRARGRILAVLFCIFHGFNECFGAGTRNRADIGNKLVMIHADAVIGNGERIRFFVGINPDLPFLGEFRLAE